MDRRSRIPRTESRHGTTFVEVLVGMTIVGLLFAMLLPAIMQARTIAEATKAKNKLRQIAIATPQLADALGGRFDVNSSLYYSMMDRLKFAEFYTVSVATASGAMIDYHGNRCFESPTDPSLVSISEIDSGVVRGNASFAYNALIAFNAGHFPELVQDGMTTTIMHTEHFARCSRSADELTTDFEYALAHSFGANSRRSSFADSLYGDHYAPALKSARAKVTSIVPSVAFQMTPKLTYCDGRLPQATSSGGLLVAMADCSVHTISPGIMPQVFSSLVTPAGSESDAALP